MADLQVQKNTIHSVATDITSEEFFKTAVRKVAELLAGKAAVVQVNTQESPALAGRFGVHGIPVVFLLRNGKIVDQLAGVQTAEALLAWCKRQF